MSAKKKFDIDDQLYRIQLELFEGPLDLLLYLIKRDELDIYDIPIERITHQTLFPYTQVEATADHSSEDTHLSG